MAVEVDETDTGRPAARRRARRAAANSTRPSRTGSGRRGGGPPPHRRPRASRRGRRRSRSPRRPDRARRRGSARRGRRRRPAPRVVLARVRAERRRRMLGAAGPSDGVDRNTEERERTHPRSLAGGARIGCRHADRRRVHHDARQVDGADQARPDRALRVRRRRRPAVPVRPAATGSGCRGISKAALMPIRPSYDAAAERLALDASPTGRSSRATPRPVGRAADRRAVRPSRSRPGSSTGPFTEAIRAQARRRHAVPGAGGRARVRRREAPGVDHLPGLGRRRRRAHGRRASRPATVPDADRGRRRRALRRGHLAGPSRPVRRRGRSASAAGCRDA